MNTKINYVIIYTYQPIGVNAVLIIVKKSDKYSMYAYCDGSFTVIAKVGNGLSSVKLLSNL